MSGVHVVKKNYLDYLPVVKDKIDRSAFISIDCEFTGLNLNGYTRSSLFDTAEKRYSKAKRSVREFTIAQFGLTAFISVAADRYEAYTYNFYLFPAPVASHDTRFTMQASSLQFLCQYGFDFNKMIYEGIPYLNEKQEANVRSYWRANVGTSLDMDTMHRDLLRKYCSQIARWLVQAKDGDIFTLEKSPDEGEISNAILHEKLIHRIDNIWPKPSTDDVLIIEKVSSVRRRELKKLNPVSDSTDQEKLVEHSVGFTNLIKHLISSQKIVVGHNVYLDLMLIYDKFINALPNSYQSYKEDLHRVLPNIYDTKYMSLQLRRPFVGTLYEYDSTNLSELYTSMADPEKRNGVLYAPSVKICDPTLQTAGGSGCESGDNVKEKSGAQIHEAGYDSYMCGYVFLRLAHLQTISNLDAALAVHPIPFYDYGRHIEPYKNRVNLIRAMLHNICLDGPDPESTRPEQLFIRTRGHSNPLNTHEISFLFSSYGSVDINKVAPNKAIAVVGNHICARKILEAFKSHDKFQVTNYSFLRHSPLVKKCIWTGALLTVGICALALFKNSRKR